jgi:hypothetical protein
MSGLTPDQALAFDKATDGEERNSRFKVVFLKDARW